MTKEERYDLYRRAVKAWGQEGQENMAIEEMSELTKELCKLKRCRGTGQPLRNPIVDKTLDNIAEELADVEITNEQLKLWVGEEKVQEAKEKKLLRLKDRIEKAENAGKN